MVLAAAVAGCTVVRTVHKIAGAVQANKTIIDQFTGDLRSGQPTAFQATYMTTGSAPSTITYAVQPPADLAIAVAGVGSKAAVPYVRYIGAASGQFWCARAAVGGWACTKLHKNATTSGHQLLDLYTPAHWVTFLQGFSLAAGFAGDKITKSSTTVNGFSMQCVDIAVKGVAGTSKICTTAQHLLGYVQVVGQPVDFEITKYSATPNAALFRLPAGAKVTSASGSGTP
jgi:hypothetical protein